MLPAPISQCFEMESSSTKKLKKLWDEPISCILLCLITYLLIFRKNEGTLISDLDLVTANNSKHHSDLEKYAISQSINIIKWPLQNLQHGEYDIGLIVAFGHLIKDDILQKFPL